MGDKDISKLTEGFRGQPLKKVPIQSDLVRGFKGGTVVQPPVPTPPKADAKK